MVEGLNGLPFILGFSVLATPAVMAIWYRGLANPETARAASIISMILLAVVAPIVTVPLRWGPNDHDGPAAGIPYFVALIEGFWVFWSGLALVLLFHRRFENLAKRQDDDEAEVFE
jgi:hypothetical protein